MGVLINSFQKALLSIHFFKIAGNRYGEV